ncbi:hypothetical protein H6P81_000216 [Aristolochia fimbriata]|uniref:GATA-type domain-containing protein n=1 Tax=Aristolochia fimbriata TaxID=158543 RepID=A0AAV7F3Q9_ARIFI|nr:hypothetical protein H6P81_000216 [Aristolochia fimbriata]
MTPIRLIPSSSSPLHEDNQEDPSDLLTLKLTSVPLISTSSSSSSTPRQEKQDHERDQTQKGEEEEGEDDRKLLDQSTDPGFSTSGSGTEDHLPLLYSSPPVMASTGDQNDGSSSTTLISTQNLKPAGLIHKEEAHDHGDHGHQCNNINGSSYKWMSSKMRVMKKMSNYQDQTLSPKPTSNYQQQPFQIRQRSPPPNCVDHDDATINSPGSSTKIRVCSDCNTTKTPLWRSGPQGPKSLCNACGIRQRKARRAMAAAAAANGGLLSVETSNMRSISTNKAIKEKRSSSSTSTHDYSSQYKKRCKLGGGPRSRKKIRFDEFTISALSKSAAFHQAVFPQDEKEAAILLMALSCGLVRG